MVNLDLALYSKGSHFKTRVYCDFNNSNKCRKEWDSMVKEILRYRKNNNNKDICLYCSRTLKFSGKGNPNNQYSIDENFFNSLTAEKTYILGFIAGDGCVSNGTTTKISIHKKDIDILNSINSYTKFNVPIILRKSRPIVDLVWSSKKLNENIRKVLNVPLGKKSAIIELPQFQTEELTWSFIRGYFDADGYVVKLNKLTPRCGISSKSKKIIEQIKAFVPYKCSLITSKINKYGYSMYSLEWCGNEALNFMSKLYDNSTIHCERKNDLYWGWSSWVPSLNGRPADQDIVPFGWKKTNPNALAPFKKRASDSGYDLTLIKFLRKEGNVLVYDTGLKVVPPYGWYFMMVPRSSLHTYGYAMVNTVGIIDRTFVGNIEVKLMPIENCEKKDLILPFRAVQLIPCPIVHLNFKEIDKMPETERNSGGFGSSGK